MLLLGPKSRTWRSPNHNRASALPHTTCSITIEQAVCGIRPAVRRSLNHTRTSALPHTKRCVGNAPRTCPSQAAVFRCKPPRLPPRTRTRTSPRSSHRSPMLRHLRCNKTTRIPLHPPIKKRNTRCWCSAGGFAALAVRARPRWESRWLSPFGGKKSANGKKIRFGGAAKKMRAVACIVLKHAATAPVRMS